jgi:ribosome maturation factor RimP
MIDTGIQLKEKIRETLNAYFEGSEFFVVEILVSATGHITVYADGQTNITIDKCVEISRFLENYLESNGLVGEKYLLEVSSPGMDEPLKVMQQFHKCVGREVEVILKNGMKEIATLTLVTEQGLTLSYPAGKKKGVEIPAEDKYFPFEEIKSTKKHFVFK